MEEIWKKVDGYGDYEVSNLGKVRSKNGIILKTDINWQGYERLYLTSVKKNVKVHRFVALAFLENPENKPYVNHKNGIKNCNNLDNLEWVTNKENCKHAWENNLINKENIAKGSRLPQSKLNEKQVVEIKNKLSYMTKTQIANEYNVNFTTIYDIWKNKTWKHIKIN